jgi:enoyl-CoA hydratase
MESEPVLARRDLIRVAAAIAVAAPATATPTLAGPSEPEQKVSSDTATLAEVPLNPDTRLTIERRGPVALFGLNRPQIQNRVDPETFRALAKAIYAYDHDPSLRAAILFGHGECFSRGIDVEGYRAVAGSGGPLVGLTDFVNPLNYGVRRAKPLIVAVHGDTWNLAHELFLSADIRIAAADTNFGQDENTHGRFPGGGATVRFAREAGWGNAMRYMLTGDHWTADEAYRMGILQEIAPTPQAALDLALVIASKVAACAPLSIQTTLASAHLAIDASEDQAFARLTAQYGALYRTSDFVEGLAAQAEGRSPVFRGN